MGRREDGDDPDLDLHLGAPGKPVYYFFLTNPSTFLANADRHDLLIARLPLRRYERPYSVRFPMGNAIRSIKETMASCGIQRSSLAPILNH